MSKDLSFENACQIVKGEYSELEGDIDKFSSILLTAGAAAAAIPIAVAVGPTVLTPAAIVLTAVGTLSNLFGVKNEMLVISDLIVTKAIGKREKDTLKMFERMKQAYTLICYTAFFEALSRNEKLTPLLKKIQITGEEKCNTVMYAAKELLSKGNTQVSEEKMGWFQFSVDLPQPGDTPETQRKLLFPLYQLLARRIENFFELEIAKKQIQESGGLEKIKGLLGQVPEEALKFFKEQYYGLAMKYPEFAIWLNLQERDRSATQLHGEMAEYSQKLTELAEIGQKATDIGFKQMEEVIKSIPQEIEQRQIDDLLKQLEIWYKNMVDKPVIDDPQQALTYPKKSDIFIPQAFQALHYTGERLERNQTWSGLPVRDDLSAFLLSYFSHPTSIKKPLIILGQPGSGKSLLTSILAARLITPVSSYTPIRVELRHVDTEASIQVQIKDQIYKDTNLQRTWGELVHCLGDRLPLVIFDGYDELLQATGKTFAGYLKDVEAFQEDELTRGHKPVRTIVTSRISLIDKAIIPKDVTVIRLLEFNQQRQEEWISRWNDINSIYFEQAQVKRFTLPQNNASINRLAEQPLLLMMLALYDSVGNPLISTKAIDQTLLYNELLRRFIERELKKDKIISQDWQKEKLDKAIDREMERLGVAAIGMFNRRRLYITKEDLSTDLKFFELEKSSLEIEEHQISSTRGRDLLPAEKMFGSFFFQQLTAVRKSTEPMADYRHQSKEDDVAYEFLHNTFGEFLSADFILRKILEETAAIQHLTGVKVFRTTLSQKIEQFDGLEPGWFARFIYAPLFSRPVIVNLLREWLQHCLRQDQRDVEEFLTNFDTIVINHINLLFTTSTLPSLIVKSDQHPFVDLSIIGYLAIYTLNLLLLRTLLAPNGYIFDETKHPRSEDGTRAWDRLTYLWRSWFSLETLNELAAILIATRKDTTIHLEIKTPFIASSSDNRLDSILNVSLSLADDITTGLSGLLSYDSFNKKNIIELGAIDDKLKSENINLKYESMTKHFRDLQLRDYNYDQIEHLQHEIVKIEGLFEIPSDRNMEAIVSFLQEFPRMIRILDSPFIYKIYRSFFDSPFPLNNNIAVELIKLAREFDDQRFLELIYREYLRSYIRKDLDFGLRGGSRRALPMELVIELIKLAREFDDRGFLEAFYREYLRSYIKKDLDFGLRGEPRRALPMELIIEMIKLAREFDDRGFLKYLYREYLRSYIRKDLDFGLRRESRRALPMELIIEMIKLARKFDDQAFLEAFYHEYLEQEIQHEIDSMPLYALKDIYWLAKQFNNKKILFEIDKKINDGIIRVTSNVEETTTKHQSIAPQIENTPPRFNERRESMSENPPNVDEEKAITNMADAFREAARKRSEENVDSTEL